MDIFVEDIVAKKKTPKDYALILLTLIAAAALLLVLITIVLPMFWSFLSIVLLIIAGVCYGAYYILGCFNIEYEYTLVNGEMDIEKIVNRKTRKKLLTLYLKEIEDFGTKRNPAFKSYKENPEIKKVYACSDETSEETFFAVYTGAGQRMMVLFSPNERIVAEIKRSNPQKELI